MSHPTVRALLICSALLLPVSPLARAERSGGLSLATTVRQSDSRREPGELKPAARIPWGREVVVNEGLPAGAWGGEHISLVVTETGAEVEYDCARGTISRRIVPDRKGRFDVPGTYVEESGGPVREQGRPKTHAARYTGRVGGGRMSFTVTLAGTREFIGRFTLARGREPSLVKCR